MDIFAQPSDSEHTVDGQTPAGALEVAFKNIGTSTAIVNGISIAPGEPINYGFVGKPYDSISFEPNGSILRVRYTL